MSAPALSLIICSCNRAEQLQRCLDALPLDECRAHGVELVLVNNASTDDTPDIMRRFAGEASGSGVDVIVVDEPNPGLSNARNAGVMASHAPLLAFTDDDCYLEPGFPGAVLHRFSRDSLDYAGGRILLHDPTDAMYTVNYDETERTFHPYRVLRPGDIQGACMVIRRHVFERLGGFDPSLGAGTPFRFEDIDMVARAAAAGFRGRHCPEFVVRHHHGRKPGGDLARLMHDNAIARGGYYASRLAAGQILVLFTWMLTHLPQLRLRTLSTEFRGAIGWFISAITTRRAAIPRIPPRSSSRGGSR